MKTICKMLKLLKILSNGIFLCVFSLCVHHEISAEETPGEEPVYLMEEIVVKGGNYSSVSEVSVGDESIKTQKARSVSDVLSDIPGVSVTVGAKNSSEIMIRGFDSSEVLIMVDGRPVNDPYYGNIDLSTIGVGKITKINVVKGADSVRFGPNAMGGVVNIITGGADDGPPFDVSFTAGSGKEIRANLVHRGTIKGIAYRIYGGRDVSKGFPLSSDFEPAPIENGNLRNNSDLRRTEIGATFLIKRPGNRQWNLTLGDTHMTKGLPSSVNEPRFWRFINWNRTSVDLDGEPIKGNTFQLKTKIYAERFLNELVDYRDKSYDPSNVYWESTHDNRSAGILLSSAYFPKDNSLTNFGLQVRWDVSRRQAEKGLDWFLNRTTATWVFVEHERSLTDNLLLRGGISGHLFSYDNWKRSSTSLDPSLYIEWNVRDYTVTGAVNRVSRFPTINQLFSSTSGNPDLNPEWALKGEVTISRSFFGVMNLSAAGFISSVHGMIYRSGKLDIYHNIEKAMLGGTEFNGTLKLSRFNIFSGLCLRDARDSSGERLEYRPLWKVDSGFNFRISPGILIHLTSQAVGRRWTERDSFIKSYHIEDAGAVFGENSRIPVSVSMKNIFDANYEEELDYPMAGRTVWVGIDYHLTGE